MKLKKKLVLISMLVFTLLFSACSQQDVYEHAKSYEENSRKKIEEIANGAPQHIEGELQSIESVMDQTAADGSRYLSGASKRAGIWIIVGSEIIGIIMILVLKNTKTTAIKIYKVAWMVFIIGIPVITLVTIYGLAFMASWFM